MIYNIIPKSVGLFVGRVWNKRVDGPSVVAIYNNSVVDITSTEAPTLSALFEISDPVKYVKGKIATAEILGTFDSLTSSDINEDNQELSLLAPCDLQAIKACGVTFAHSMLERFIEEKAEGDARKATEIRDAVKSVVGSSLSNIVPGSAASAELKKVLQDKNMWSQYLEVGIGPYAEVFTKAQPLSAIGYGGDIGIHPESHWNNPEPEIVLAVNSMGKTVGATLGNDVNLRDFEGRSALLLGKAKDNNASCAIGPLIRLFDETYSIDDVRSSFLELEVKGQDGFKMQGSSSMSEISRDPLDLVQQTISVNHQYPDGLMLFLGTLFAPTQDRDQPGSGFTHKVGDHVLIKNEHLGCLANSVNTSNKCAPWEFGITHLMKNLASRNLL